MSYHTNFLPQTPHLQIVNQSFSQLPWWVKITTAIPSCTYYFGPFDSQEEATIAQYDYIEDLLEENARGIETKILKEQPQELTI